MALLISEHRTPLPADQIETWQPFHSGKKTPRMLEIDEVGLENIDALEADRGRECITLQVDQAGWPFSEHNMKINERRRGSRVFNRSIAGQNSFLWPWH